MAYDKNTRLANSKLAYKILRVLKGAETDVKEEENPQFHSKQIAEKIGSTRPSVANYIKLLKDRNLIKVAKRTRAKYYELNINGFVGLFNQLWEKYKEESKKEIEKELEKPEKSYEDLIVPDYNDYIPIENEFLKEIIVNYSLSYLWHVEASNLRKMLIEDFISNLVDPKTKRREHMLDEDEAELLEGLRDACLTLYRWAEGMDEGKMGILGRAMEEKF